MVDPKDVDACEGAMKKATEGCDWVTPIAITIPLVCQGILKGKLVDKELKIAFETDQDKQVRGAALRALAVGFGADAKTLIPMIAARLKFRAPRRAGYRFQFLG